MDNEKQITKSEFEYTCQQTIKLIFLLPEHQFTKDDLWKDIQLNLYRELNVYPRPGIQDTADIVNYKSKVRWLINNHGTDLTGEEAEQIAEQMFEEVLDRNAH